MPGLSLSGLSWSAYHGLAWPLVTSVPLTAARDMNDIYDNIDSLYDIIGAYTQPAAILAHNAINGPGYFADASSQLHQ